MRRSCLRELGMGNRFHCFYSVNPSLMKLEQAVRALFVSHDYYDSHIRRNLVCNTAPRAEKGAQRVACAGMEAAL